MKMILMMNQPFISESSRGRKSGFESSNKSSPRTVQIRTIRKFRGRHPEVLRPCCTPSSWSRSTAWSRWPWPPTRPLKSAEGRICRITRHINEEFFNNDSFTISSQNEINLFVQNLDVLPSPNLDPDSILQKYFSLNYQRCLRITIGDWWSHGSKESTMQSKFKRVFF